MKTLILSTLLSTISLVLNAQDNKNKDESVYLQTIFSAQKRELVQKYIPIEEYEKASFWDVYSLYEAEQKLLTLERIVLLKQYMEGDSTLSDREANNISKRLLANSLNQEKITKRFYNKFKKATSAVTAAQFIQLERYVQNTFQSYLQDGLFKINEDAMAINKP